MEIPPAKRAAGEDDPGLPGVLHVIED